MREIEYVKFCRACNNVYPYDDAKTACICNEPLYNGFTNEHGELEKTKVVSADVVYKDKDGKDVLWHHKSLFGENQIDMFYEWDNCWESFFEQEAEMRKDNFNKFLKIKNLIIDNPNGI